MIVGLLGFVKSDPAFRNEISNALSDGDKKIFEKKSDYLKLISILSIVMLI